MTTHLHRLRQAASWAVLSTILASGGLAHANDPEPPDTPPNLTASASVKDPATEPVPPPPLEASDKRRLTLLGAELPRHGVLPIAAPSESAPDAEWLRYARRVLNVFSPSSMKPPQRTKLLESRPLAPAIEALVPRHRRYLALQEMLALFAQRMGQPVTPLPETRYQVRLGVTAPEVGLLRDRLRAEGYGDEGVTGKLRDYFDDRLRRALQAWQRDKKLPVTIALDPLTRRRLNAPIEQPIADIALALARFRSLDLRRDEGIQLVVHVNAFSLVAERDGRAELGMPVVVGKNTDKDQTPMLSAPLYAIVVNPSWNVPHRLVEERLRPEAKDIPEVLIDKGYEVNVDPNTGRWRVRMRPGPENPLGKLKFLLTDTQSIYLHDTPQRNAFGKDTRTLSAGCVRLSDPQALARFLLPGRELQLEEAMAYDTTTSTMNLQTPVPTHLMYQTALVEDGRLVRFTDIYGRDPAALANIDGPAIARALGELLQRDTGGRPAALPVPVPPAVIAPPADPQGGPR